MGDYEFLKIDRQGAVTYLTLNRPQRRNALTHRMMLELEDAFVGIGNDAACRVLVLRGAGGHFCAGGDLDTMADLPPVPPGGTDPLLPTYRQFGNALLALESLPQATIAVVEGSAVGAGFGMACCSDVVILREDARFGIPEPRVGFIPSQIIPFLVRRLGEGPVRDLAVTGRVIDAAESYRLGIGRHLCATGGEVEATLQSVLDDILRMEPKALAVAKRLVQSCAKKDDLDVLDEAAGNLVGLLRQPEAAEGIRHFMAKTTPSWAKR